MVRHGDDVERDYDGGAVVAASAMVRESEGEELGRKRRVCELGEEWVTDPRQQNSEGRKQGGGQLRGARWCRRRAPACLPGRVKQLAVRLLGWAD